MLAALIMLMLSCDLAGAANVMNYGADGNDYFQFTTPSMAFDKASGFTTLIAFAMHVDTDGTLELGGGPVCTNGVYVGPTNWNSLVTTAKSPPTTVTRYEVSIGGWLDTSYDNIKSLITAQGNGPSSMLYKNLQALKNAVPGIDAINDDDEKTYDLTSSTKFANMLGGLGYKFTTVPYQNQTFWVNLNNAVTNCDYIYLQCYQGGAGNDPGQWNTAFGHGVKVIPGQESNTANPATWRSWYQETGTQGGFFYPDVVFNTTYWSAIVYQANGTVPAAPTNVVAVAGGGQVSLSWNTDPSAISYNIKRSTVSGGETNIASISTVNNSWPNSNQYRDFGLTGNVTYYYQISGVNTNGEGVGSMEVIVTPSSGTNYNAGVLALNPVGFWPLNETSGTTAFDASGHGHNGAYQPGVKLGVAGVSNPPFAGFGSSSLAAGFSSSSNTSWVTFANLPINANTVTFTAWIYPTGSLGALVWDNGISSGLGTYWLDGSELGYNWNGNNWGYQSGLRPPLNQWSFVAMVITPTNAVFYINNANGQYSATDNESTTVANFSSSTTLVGSVGPANPGATFNGSMADVAVFNYSLTSTQITQLFADSYSAITPPAPTGLTAVPGYTQLILTWNSSSGATSYNVKRSTTSGGETTIANVVGTNYTDSGLANGTTYYYKVSALNSGVESANSSEASAIPSLAITNYNAGVLALNPVGFWPLNETSGTTAFDASGHGNNGTYKSGVTLGLVGVSNPPYAGFGSGSLAAGFRGSTGNNSCVTLTNLPINSTNVTITEWIYPTNASAIGTTFWNSGQNAGLSQAFNNNAALGYNWHGGDGGQWNYTAFTPPVNQWSFVAMVITPTNAVFYMGNTNGLSSMINNDGNSAVNFTTGTSIGGPNDGSTTGFNGSLNDVAVFNYSLTSTQITQLFADGYAAPVILSQSASQTNYSGSTIQLVVSATANSPLNYQWKAGPIGSGVYTNVVNGGNISGATRSTLVITNATLANAADYIVVVSNAQGIATSATPTTEEIVNFTITITSPMPPAAFLYPGGNVRFSANVVGAPPITCLWQRNGITIQTSTFGANADSVTNTASVLNILNVTDFDANSYYLVATNVYGSTTSAPISLTVLSNPGNYAQAVFSDSPIAYWRFDEASGTIAYDYAGGHNAIYGNETVYGFDGPSSPQWPGFESNNHAFIGFPGFSDTTVVMPASEGLNLNTNTLTIAAWVYFYEEGQSGGIVFQRDASGIAGFNVGPNGDLGYNWNNDLGTYGWDSGLKLPLLQWAFVAWVLTPTNSTLYLNSANGQTNATLVHNHANMLFSGAIGIGCDPYGGNGEPIFNGVIDEVAVFDYSLTPAKISQLYLVAGSGGQTVMATNRPSITANVSASTLNLSWPGDHLGWIVQSNSVCLASTNAWFDIPNSQNGTNIVIRVSPGMPNVFFRLRYPNP